MLRKIVFFAVLTACFPAFAQMSEEGKISGLIDSVRLSEDGLRFVRNGSSYDGADAADHLQMKYDHAKDKIKTAEEFIDNLASKSSFSGKDYMIVYPDGRTVTAKEFFTERLWRLENGP